MATCVYAIENGEAKLFVGVKGNALSQAKDLAAQVDRIVQVWEYEPLDWPKHQLYAAMLNGGRWWFSRTLIATYPNGAG